MADARQQLEKAREQSQKASEQMGEKNLGQAASSGARAEKDLQKLTDTYSTKIDAHVVTKEKEIMTV